MDRLPSITLRQLAYFAAVAEQGSLTAAAEKIHLSQSALSTAVSELERQFEVQLFIRHARGLSLTRDGERLLAEARALLGDADALQRNARGLQHELTGSITVGCYPTILSSLLPRVIAEFTTAHPRISLDIREGNQDDLLSWLSTGRLDLAIAYDYHLDRELADLGFTSTVLARIPPYLLLPPEHPFAGRDAVSLSELVDDPMILLDTPPSADYFRSLFTRVGTEPNVAFRTSSYDTVRGLVAHGVGYSILTQRAPHPVAADGAPYAALDLTDEFPALEVAAIVPAGRRLSRRVRTFIESAERRLIVDPAGS
ncbi:LysR substrate-binding domain-containing protein [Brachybacterium subflavum]|uniref:LysR substrate-binding domain-containing protein n=1 Tax=Brachybacterium subflavum TaxID=2585206 RepID=UPI0012661129|nr:LysR substrate-binding domain-containing protein [Brachybacterium subflavum]